jgi:hypothetical protein
MIPVPIQANKHDHRKPYPGDQNIHFEPIEKPQAAAAATAEEPRPPAKVRRKAAR